MRARHVIYAGPPLAGRSTSLEVLFPQSQHALGMRRFAGGATEFEFAGDQVRVATDDLRPSILLNTINRARAASEATVDKRRILYRQHASRR